MVVARAPSSVMLPREKNTDADDNDDDAAAGNRDSRGSLLVIVRDGNSCTTRRMSSKSSDSETMDVRDHFRPRSASFSGIWERPLPGSLDLVDDRSGAQK